LTPLFEGFTLPIRRLELTEVHVPAQANCPSEAKKVAFGAEFSANDTSQQRILVRSKY